MSGPTLRTTEGYGTSPRANGGGRDRIVRAYRDLYNSASEDAAHQRMRRVEREYLNLITLLARENATDRLERHRLLVEATIAAHAPDLCLSDSCLLQATREEHHADQLQDTARLELVAELAPDREDRAIRALIHELATKRRKLTILLSRKAARHG